MPHKRSNYLEWQEYFMSIAFLSAKRSKDPRTQVGACIVNSKNKIVGIGYNGMPIGCSDDKMPWNRASDKSTDNWLNSKTPYVCHAELNAVLNKNQADVTGCSIYVALFPCNMCAQIIVQSGIKEVVYYSDKYHERPEMIASRRLLNMADVKYRQFTPRQKKVVIDFESIESTPDQEPTLKTDIAGDAVSSSNGEDSAKDTTTEFVNNNNMGVEKRSSFYNHDDLMNVPPHLVHEAQEGSESSTSFQSLAVNIWQMSYISLVLIIAVAFISWLVTKDFD